MTATSLPNPPYYAVIFVNQRSSEDSEGYGNMADRMVELAQKQQGYLGIESVREDGGKGITVSYWQDIDSIKAWKENMDHCEARKLGKEKWYDDYQLQIAKVEQGYRWIRN